MSYLNGYTNTPPTGKFALDNHFLGCACLAQIIEHPVNGHFVKAQFVPVGTQVELERLGLQTGFIRNISYGNIAEIRLIGVCFLLTFFGMVILLCLCSRFFPL